MNEEVQQEIYQQIIEVVGHERDPVSGSLGHISSLYQYSRIGARGLRQARQSSLCISGGPAIIPYGFSQLLLFMEILIVWNIIIASGYLMIRTAFEDTVLQIPNPRGEEGDKTIPVPKGTLVRVYSPMIHRLFRCSPAPRLSST